MALVALKIAPLTADVARQISSGNAITSVHSAIQELCENALDAGATSIDVKIEDGGLQLLSVADNGTGIDPANMTLVGQRHHTSKLRSSEDLEQISTYGFRGEALNSLCALAEVQLISKTANEPVGTSLTYATDGSILSSSKVPRERGTTVIVRKLFSNLPVRRQSAFAKSKTEEKAIEDVVITLALVHPECRFQLKHGSQTLITKPVTSSYEDGIRSVFGPELVHQLQLINYSPTDDFLAIEGFLPSATSDYTVASRNKNGRCFLYVNARPITTKDIITVIVSKYTKHLVRTDPSLGKRYPFIFLNLKMKQSEYDVNLDPNKQSVLFQRLPEILRHLEAMLEPIYPTPLADIFLPATPQSSSSVDLSSAFSSPERGSRDHHEAGSDAMDVDVGTRQSLNEPEERADPQLEKQLQVDNTPKDPPRQQPDDQIQQANEEPLVRLGESNELRKDASLSKETGEHSAAQELQAASSSKRTHSIRSDDDEEVFYDDLLGPPVAQPKRRTLSIPAKSAPAKSARTTQTLIIPSLAPRVPVQPFEPSEPQVPEPIEAPSPSKRTPSSITVVPKTSRLIPPAAENMSLLPFLSRTQLQPACMRGEKDVLSYNLERLQHITNIGSPNNNNNKTMAVGWLKNNQHYCAISHQGEVWVLHYQRLLELRVFEGLLDSFALPREQLESPIFLDPESVGGAAAWDLLDKLDSVSLDRNVRFISDRNVVLNGFDICFRQAARNMVCVVEVKSMCRVIDNYGLQDLRILLQLMLKTRETLHRPERVRVFLQEEAKRQAKEQVEGADMQVSDIDMAISWLSKQGKWNELNALASTMPLMQKIFPPK